MWNKLHPLKWSLKLKIFNLVLLITLSGGFWYWHKQSDQSQSVTQTISVQKADLVDSLTLSGQVEQSNLISVITKASGVVSHVYVTDGQYVQAGDKLADITLDSEGQNNQAQAWATYLNAQKNLQTAQASQYTQQAQMLQNWDAYIDLTNESQYSDPNSAERELVDFKVVENAWLASELNYKSQDIALSSANASLSQAGYNYSLYKATITAPVDGLVAGLNLAEGLTISGSTNSSGGAVSQSVATLKTEGTPVASFTVTEIDIASIESGMTIDLTLDSYPDEVFPGTIVAVDRVGTVTSGVTQYTVLASFDQNDDRILPHMATTAELVLDEKPDTLVLPISAVFSGKNNQTMVRVLKNGQVQPITVEVGLETDTMVEIVSGLSEGDQVLLTTEVTTSTPSQPGSGMGTGAGRSLNGGVPPMIGGH